MRSILVFIILLSATINVLSQSDSLSNSFDEHYKKTNPTITYKYDNKKQIHDYSNNWDFDKDGKLDNLYFVGTGGAHLYYFLRIVLSSDNIRRDFPFIESDFPILPKEYELNKTDYRPTSDQTFFAVFNNNKENDLTIFVKLDKATYAVTNQALKKKGVTTSLVTVSFKKGKAVLKDFIDQKKG